MSEQTSTVESLSTARGGWARVTGMVTAARRRRAPGNGYFETSLMSREAYRL
ncbi:MAG: hypothetical protein U0Q20_03345 [Mycobacterium sp.]|nr:hypothetical protein [Mycobacterium sp.]